MYPLLFCDTKLYDIIYSIFLDGPDSAALLGTLDTSFLLTYGIAMFASGFVAERVSLRYFLTFGMLFSAIFSYLFGMAKVYDIHSFAYFVLVQAFAGIFQTTGWPGVVTVVGRWFGRSKRGLIFGIWNSHTSIGNILGTLIAGYYVEKDWSMSFIMPAMIMGIVAIVVFLFLVDSPEIVSCQVSRSESRRSSSNYNYNSIEDGINQSEEENHQRHNRSDSESPHIVEQVGLFSMCQRVSGHLHFYHKCISISLLIVVGGVAFRFHMNHNRSHCTPLRVIGNRISFHTNIYILTLTKK